MMDQGPKLLGGGRRCFSAGVSRSLRCVEEGREAEEDVLADASHSETMEKKHVPLFGKACYALTENSNYFFSLTHSHGLSDKVFSSSARAYTIFSY